MFIKIVLWHSHQLSLYITINLDMTPLLFQFHQCHLFCVADLFSWKIFVTSCFSPRADPSTYKFHDVFFTRGSRQVFPARYIVGPKYQDHRNDYHFIHIILFLKGTGIEKGKSNFQSGQPDAQKPHFSSLKKWFFGHMLFLYIYIYVLYTEDSAANTSK